MITRHQHLEPELQSEVLKLIASATDKDGVPPVAEHVLLHLRHGGDKSDIHLLARKDNQVAGYAHLDNSASMCKAIGSCDIARSGQVTMRPES